MTTLRVLEQELRQGKIRPCYFIWGGEPYLVRTASDLIRKNFLGEGAAGAQTADSIEHVDAAEIPIARILDAARTGGLFSQKRLILIRNGEKLKKKDWAELQSYLVKPSPANCIVITASEPREAGKKELGGPCLVLECKKISSRELPTWIHLEASRHGLHISQEVTHFLSEVIGPSLSDLAQVLCKLSLFVGEKKIIEIADVEKVCHTTGQKNLFALTKAIGEKKRIPALRLLDHLIEFGEEPVRLLGFIHRHFRILAGAQELSQQGRGPSEIARELRVHPFFIREYLEQISNFDPNGWPKIFRRLYETDKSLKSSRLKPQLILENLVGSLTSEF